MRYRVLYKHIAAVRYKQLMILSKHQNVQGLSALIMSTDENVCLKIKTKLSFEYWLYNRTSHKNNIIIHKAKIIFLYTFALRIAVQRTHHFPIFIKRQNAQSWNIVVKMTNLNPNQIQFFLERGWCKDFCVIGKGSWRSLSDSVRDWLNSVMLSLDNFFLKD